MSEKNHSEYLKYITERNSRLNSLIEKYITELNSLKIESLHPYHPKYRGRFDENSARVLNLKNGYIKTIEYYVSEIEKVIERHCCPIVSMPPSDPTKTKQSGIRQVASTLGLRGMKDWSALLVRKYRIPQKTMGGERSLLRELSSMEVTAKLHGNRIMLLDDVTTTGNSMKAGYILLREAGASEVFCQAIGQTQW